MEWFHGRPPGSTDELIDVVGGKRVLLVVRSVFIDVREDVIDRSAFRSDPLRSISKAYGHLGIDIVVPSAATVERHGFQGR